MEFQVQTDAASAGAGAVGNTQILDTPRHNSDTTQVTPRYYPSTTQVLLRYYSDNPLNTTQVTPLHHGATIFVKFCICAEEILAF